MSEEPAIYLVFSNHHSAFWGENEAGYTKRIDRAGRYTASDARKISETRDGGKPDADGVYPEVVVMAPEVEGMLLKLQSRIIELQQQLEALENQSATSAQSADKQPEPYKDTPAEIEALREYVRSLDDLPGGRNGDEPPKPPFPLSNFPGSQHPDAMPTSGMFAGLLIALAVIGLAAAIIHTINAQH